MESYQHQAKHNSHCSTYKCCELIEPKQSVCHYWHLVSDPCKSVLLCYVAAYLGIIYFSFILSFWSTEFYSIVYCWFWKLEKTKHPKNNFSFNHVLQSTQNILQLCVLHNIMSMSYALYYPNCYWSYCVNTRPNRDFIWNTLTKSTLNDWQ